MFHVCGTFEVEGHENTDGRLTQGNGEILQLSVLFYFYFTFAILVVLGVVAAFHVCVDEQQSHRSGIWKFFLRVRVSVYA